MQKSVSRRTPFPSKAYFMVWQKIGCSMSTKPLAADLMQSYLACPGCRAEIHITARQYSCAVCGSTGEIQDGVFLAKSLPTAHYFNDMHQLMQKGNYSPQPRLLSSMVRPGEVVVDIGCGPVVHFEKHDDCVLIGVDPSFDSIRANRKLDIRVFGSAVSMPLRDGSVDRISLLTRSIT